MKLLNNTFQLSKEDVEAFTKKGYLKLEKFFSSELTNYIDDRLQSSLQIPADNYGVEFNKIGYDVLNEDPILIGLLNDELFAKTMTDLSGKSLLFTQTVAFELAKGIDPGFSWHADVVSFSFHQIDDLGLSLWVPLVDIDFNGQGGGMSYISKSVFSGQFLYQHTMALTKTFKPALERLGDNEEVRAEIYKKHCHYEEEIVNSPEMSKILDANKEQDNFRVGDVLVFDKHVLHRSVRLEEGPICSRRALSIRFIDIGSTYDQERVADWNYVAEKLHFIGSSDFNTKVGKKNGDLIVDSPFFRGRENRILRM